MDFEHIGLSHLSIGAAPAHSTATPARFAWRWTPSTAAWTAKSIR